MRNKKLFQKLPKKISTGYKRTVVILLIVFSLSVLLAMMEYIATYERITGQRQKVSKSEEIPSEKDEIKEWKTYKNRRYGFEFKYPSFMHLASDKEKYDAGLGENDAVIEYDEESEKNMSDNRDYGDFVAIKMQNEQLNPSSIKTIEGIAFSNKDVQQGVVPKVEWKLWKRNYDGTEIYLMEFSSIGKSGVEAIIPFYDKILYIQFVHKISENNYPEKIISTFKFSEKDIFSSCGTVVDTDSNIYETVKIGNQCWMKDNLKVSTSPKGNVINRKCFNYNCKDNGGLYDWRTAMDNSTIEGVQGICPNGWHIPKDSEWHDLENYLKDGESSCASNRIGWDCDKAGAKLKSGGASGFEGLLAGGGDQFGYGYNGSQGYFWSSTEKRDQAWYRILDVENSRIARNAYNKAASYSIRCLKD